jgi:hypothetical protein
MSDSLRTARPWSDRALRLQADVKPTAPQYLGRVLSLEFRRIVPIFALAVAIVAAVTDPATPGELLGGGDRRAGPMTARRPETRVDGRIARR